MKDRLNKRLIVMTLFVSLLAIPLPGTLTSAQTPAGGGARSQNCQAARNWELLFAITAFGLAFTPFAPISIAYTVAALGAKAYEVINC